MAKAIPCPCGQRGCSNWLVDPQAAVQGVRFTQQEAEAVAKLLNIIEANAKAEAETKAKTKAEAEAEAEAKTKAEADTNALLEAYARGLLLILETVLILRGTEAFGMTTPDVSAYCNKMRKDLGWPKFGQKRRQP